jgi:hypothetical protein
MCWSIRDAIGQVHQLRPKAYYVPDATISLFSPQKYLTSVTTTLLLHSPDLEQNWDYMMAAFCLFFTNATVTSP